MWKKEGNTNDSHEDRKKKYSQNYKRNPANNNNNRKPSKPSKPCKQYKKIEEHKNRGKQLKQTN